MVHRGAVLAGPAQREPLDQLLLVHLESMARSTLAILSSIFACSRLRGNPSRMTPPLTRLQLLLDEVHDQVVRHQLSGVHERLRLDAEWRAVRTASRSRSPVDILVKPSSAHSLSVCVPLPEPGGPSMTIFRSMLRPNSFPFIILSEADGWYKLFVAGTLIIVRAY